MAEQEGILSGIRVIELSAFIACPLGGALLASLGAEVIRVEQIGGGIDAKRWPLHEGRSLYRAGLDQGKKLVSVDLSSEKGQQVVVDLMTAPGEDAGIVITNLPIRSWMSYEKLSAIRPDLIMLQITGSSDGRSAVDYTVNAAMGYPFITGPVGTEAPVNHALPAWDIAAGFMLSTAILAADRQRKRSGKGSFVGLGLADVAMSVANHLGYLAEAKLIDEPRGRFGNAIFGSYGRDFRTSDGRYVMICALTARQWKSLIAATEIQEAIKQLEADKSINLFDEGDRFAYREDIDGLVASWMSKRSFDEAKVHLDEHEVLWSPYLTFKEMVEQDPTAADPYSTAVEFSGFERKRALPASHIGADTTLVLSETLGLGPDVLASLQSEGVIE